MILIILGWIVWVVILILALGLSITLPKFYKTHSHASHGKHGSAFITLSMWIDLVVFILNPDWNKLHLLWVLPITIILLSIFYYTAGWLREKNKFKGAS